MTRELTAGERAAIRSALIIDNKYGYLCLFRMRQPLYTARQAGVLPPGLPARGGSPQGPRTDAGKARRRQRSVMFDLRPQKAPVHAALRGRFGGLSTCNTFCIGKLNI